MQFGMFGDPGLEEERRLLRVDPACQPVSHHLPDIVSDLAWRLVMRGQRMPVRNKEKTGMQGLQPSPIFESAMIMAEMQRAGGSHSRDNAFRRIGRASGGGQSGVHKSAILPVLRRGSGHLDLFNFTSNGVETQTSPPQQGL